MKQLDPKSVYLFFVSYTLRWVFPILLLSMWVAAFANRLMAQATEEGSRSFFYSYITWLLVLIPLFLIISFIWAKLTYRFYKYELTDAGFRKELGVIYKKYVTIPYDRIQNVDIYRGIWARVLGLSDLNIQTAGYSAVVTRYGSYGFGSEGRLPGLSREVAEELRNELIKRARQSKNQGI